MDVLDQTLIDVCALADIPPRGARVVKAGGTCIAVFRTALDEVFALNDQCPHKGGPLSQGIVHDRAVTCPLHSLVLDLETGSARGPDEGRVVTHPVEVRRGRVLIDLRGLKAEASRHALR
ncbi:hypothetical protein PB2503_13594 [Parvularcula bermudensis HTCC2503]|uniref:Rieske domain-containing protein n=1 Tax=Parvularcula bermudensis (strain ATCC BAA-594 / HTCC2503 / KCTC 12087) TaxID=314260 RepID=E0THG4_PARBH|nr:nitrite reductase small subunit NirD [Parvularcula bermudensis]ADM10756.1 hypothetical protein PB2503_13594 [Parvularcula bermudensis HTCC2503]